MATSSKESDTTTLFVISRRPPWAPLVWDETSLGLQKTTLAGLEEEEKRFETGHHKSEDTSDSREDEAAVSLLSVVFLLFCLTALGRMLMVSNLKHTHTPHTLNTHILVTKQQ
ncbi:hypothetical protein EYF80_001903 [Liparis tanakae]|uniref:Uncharacterized protein n=1 Tax=Liparis tanakae TaxID=230148 RepID=A0A4Z2JCJ4_9TELE|nr:hypothetical protein EYF80_001903 [Liparis tanakae]